MSTGRKPNFLIIGAPKCGTTALARYLETHPQVFVAPEKELRYFDQSHDLGLDWYLDHFRRAEDELAIGEATPTYMAHPQAPSRMAEVVPEARLVAILRNPVDRAYSHYWQVRRRGHEPRDFAQAVEQEHPAGVMSLEEQARAYLGFGQYMEQLSNFVPHYPRASIHVLILEELVAEPAVTLSELHRFLGVDDTFVPANIGRVYNPSYRYRSWRFRSAMLRARAWTIAPGLARRLDRLNRDESEYPAMDDATRARLLEHFAPHNQALADWLGYDLKAWHD